MTAPLRPINLSAVARMVEVDNRMPLHFYYRIADNLLKQNMFNILDELESLTPAAQRQIEELKIVYERARQQKMDAGKTPAYRASSPSLEWPPTDSNAFNSGAASMSLQPKQKYISHCAQTSVHSNNQLDHRLQMLSLNRPLPRKDTLSRHSILGTNGLSGSVWSPLKADFKVQYPSSSDLIINDNASLIEAVQYDCDNGKSRGNSMESVLSLDDGRWSTPQNEPRHQINYTEDENFFQLVKQPSPPPILAQKIRNILQSIHQKLLTHLEPVKMMDDFLRLAQENTTKNLETSGVLAEKQGVPYHYLIIPKQDSTSDSCQTLNEEDIFEFRIDFPFSPLAGYIHTLLKLALCLPLICTHITHTSYLTSCLRSTWNIPPLRPFWRECDSRLLAAWFSSSRRSSRR